MLCAVARTRVHELAKEFGVEPKWVIERLREMGESVRSASSQVDTPAELRFRAEIGERLRAGQAPETVAAASAARRSSTKRRMTPPKPPRRTSWDDSPFSAGDADLWRRYGLGDGDAGLALYLLENGLLPEDLRLDLRGRSAAHRLREGIESRTVLVREMIEVRSSAPAVARDLPSTKVVRRFIGQDDAQGS
jgi:hypothetical protein